MTDKVPMNTKKRHPLIAAILSLLVPGLGHIYAGNPGKGWLIIGFVAGLLLIAGLFGFLSTFYGFVSFFSILLVIYIYALVSAVRLAFKNRDYTLKSYNRWYWYLAIFVAVTLILQIIASSRGKLLGYEIFRIGSKPMGPVLQVGDFITANTRFRDVEVGDVVIFIYPRDRSLSFVKRVAAVGGDTLSISEGIVYRNGKHETLLDVPADLRTREASISMEEIVIPESEVFVLGDWRDNSNDSRFWGTVPVSDITSKATYIFYSSDRGRIGKAVE